MVMRDLWENASVSAFATPEEQRNAGDCGGARAGQICNLPVGETFQQIHRDSQPFAPCLHLTQRGNVPKKVRNIFRRSAHEERLAQSAKFRIIPPCFFGKTPFHGDDGTGR